eukprot:SAG31_NODE_3695_length_3980_cov_6.104870_5_plen_186_part_00
MLRIHRYKEVCDFATIYVTEAHPKEGWSFGGDHPAQQEWLGITTAEQKSEYNKWDVSQPKSTEERVEIAKGWMASLKPQSPYYCDPIDNKYDSLDALSASLAVKLIAHLTAFAAHALHLRLCQNVCTLSKTEPLRTVAGKVHLGTRLRKLELGSQSGFPMLCRHRRSLRRANTAQHQHVWRRQRV